MTLIIKLQVYRLFHQVLDLLLITGFIFWGGAGHCPHHHIFLSKQFLSSLQNIPMGIYFLVNNIYYYRYYLSRTYFFMLCPETAILTFAASSLSPVTSKTNEPSYAVDCTITWHFPLNKLRCHFPSGHLSG